MRMEVSIEGEQMRERCASRAKFIFIADSYFDKHVEKITFEKFFFTHSNERKKMKKSSVVYRCEFMCFFPLYTHRELAVVELDNFTSNKR